jgi:hypothetical protein
MARRTTAAPSLSAGGVTGTGLVATGDGEHAASNTMNVSSAQMLRMVAL